MPYKDKVKDRASKLRSHYRARYSALSHYSGGVPKCSCCGIDELKFLSLDHIEGGGGKARKEQGYPRWHKMKNDGYPPGFQVLCHNCNLAKGYYGECPHVSLMREIGGLA